MTPSSTTAQVRPLQRNPSHTWATSSRPRLTKAEFHTCRPPPTHKVPHIQRPIFPNAQRDFPGRMHGYGIDASLVALQRPKHGPIARAKDAKRSIFSRRDKVRARREGEISDRAYKKSHYSDSRASVSRNAITFVLHQSTDFLPSPEIPNLDNLVSASGREPFSTLWGCSNSFDMRDVRGENKDRFQRPLDVRRCRRGN
jgi:hypothetical protein